MDFNPQPATAMEVDLTPADQAKLCATNYGLIDYQCNTGGYECHLSNQPQQAQLICTVDPPQYFQCPYYNVSSPCEIGYYCPDSTSKYECNAGYFCPNGSSRPYECPFSMVSCPFPGMEYPIGALTFLLYFVVFTIGLIFLKYFTLRILENNEKVLSDATDEESRQLAQEQESNQYKKTLLSLSEQICDRPTMKMAATRIVHISHVDESELSEESRERAKRNWRKLLKSRAFQDHVKVLKDRSKNLVNHMTGTFAFLPVSNPLTIAFNHLNLNLKKNGNPILRDIFGCFRPFNVTALMGSSGCGKTTLLTLLRGKAHYAVTSGEIRINGAITPSLLPFSDVMAYVPQDDIMYDELTVSENLTYAALLFNKRGFEKAKHTIPMVHHSMELLGLSFVKHSIVGSPEQKGISGGQKKRVSIGMELMKEPSLFFLDEPTSGLDSASSISLMNSLAKISQMGVTVCATLHQPRIEIFDIINMLYLLAPGGRVAYFGPGFGLASHMRQLGFHCPASSNISDFVMDVISGFVRPAWDNSASVQDTVKHICDFTYDKLHSKFEKEVLLSRHRTESGIYGHVMTEEELAAMKGVTTRWHTFLVCFSRQLKIYNRTIATKLSPPYVHLLMGVLISKLFGTVRLEGDLAAQVMSSQLAFAITVQPIALKLFQNDTLMRRREDEGGIKMAPLYIGKLFGNYMDLIIAPLAFTCGYYPFIRALAPIHEYMFLFFLLMLTITGMTNLCAIIFSRYAGTMAGGILIVLWAVGGMEPTVSKTRENLGIIGEILIFLTPYRKTYEMAIVMELDRYSEYYTPMVDIFYKYYSVKDNRYGISVLYLILHWLVTNTLAMLAMMWMRDNYCYWRDFKDLYLYPCVDRVLTSDIFIALENAWNAVVDKASAVDQSIARIIERGLVLLGLSESDENQICGTTLQEFLMMTNKGLDDYCDKCQHRVNEHRRQTQAAASKWGLSSQAKQRTHAQDNNAIITENSRASARNVFTRHQSEKSELGSSFYEMGRLPEDDDDFADESSEITGLAEEPAPALGSSLYLDHSDVEMAAF